MPTPLKRSTKSETASPTLLTFSFQSTPPATYRVTRVAWTPDAYRIVAGLSEALYKYTEKKKLPIRDLRLRTQVYDPGTVRVASTLGIGFLDAPKEEHDILFTSSSPADAIEYANAAVADWVNEAVYHVEGLKNIDKEEIKKLRRFALDEKTGVVTARVEEVPIFQWSINPTTNSALFPRDTAKPDRPLKTGFADLADYVASLLVGKTVFSGAGVMRLEITADLKRGSARLLTDPLPVSVGATAQCWISLGLTIKVETYPGRPLPVIRVSMEKRVWTTAPKPRSIGNDLGGYALPQGELRAFKFSLNTYSLEPREEYRAIARRYTDLPVRDDLTGLELAQNGLSYTTRILITAAPGRSGVKVAGRGVTDLDKQLAFEAITHLLGEHGFTPWGEQLKLVDTGTKTLTQLTGQWEVMLDKKKTKETLKTQAYKKWAQALHAGLKQYYSGTHRLLLAYQSGLEEDAERVERILKAVLGAKGVVVTRQMLPDKVHGPRRIFPGEKAPKPLERAELRQAIWVPWLEDVKTNYAEEKKALPHGVLVLARKKYETDRDDPISKQVGRVSIIKSLKGALVQYLLPSASDPQIPPTEKQLKAFQMRVMNGWRDLALKSVGRMHDLPALLDTMPYVQRTGGKLPVLLGAGIVRVNKTNQKRNRTSFIPYLVELDPTTGECQAAIMLRKPGANSAAKIFKMQPLKKAVLEIAGHGPSYLAVVDKRKSQQIMTERQQLTEKFLYETLLDRTTHYKDREVVLLADSYTLSGIWQWLADAKVNPADVSFPLLGRSKVQEVMPNLTIVRLRREHAAKVLLPTPQIKVTFGQVDGTDTEPRPSARWADAKLYHVTDGSPLMPTYLSFGSRISKVPRGVSSYRPTVSHKQKKAEDNSPFTEKKENSPYTDTWATPNALEITVLQDPGQPARFTADELAFLVEKLRSAYDHFGGWTTMPGPLHFASVLKQYIPDYDLAEAEAIDRETDDE
jgi:hypothetical protein